MYIFHILYYRLRCQHLLYARQIYLPLSSVNLLTLLLIPCGIINRVGLSSGIYTPVQDGLFMAIYKRLFLGELVMTFYSSLTRVSFLDTYISLLFTISTMIF